MFFRLIKLLLQGLGAEHYHRTPAKDQTFGAISQRHPAQGNTANKYSILHNTRLRKVLTTYLDPLLRMAH
jgi:hypothetical protein